MEKASVLVVGGNELLRESIMEVLRRQGHDVEGAAGGAQALEDLHPGQYDLIVSDLKMPGMSGIELLERVKQVDPDVTFLIVTAFGEVETAVSAMKKGAYDFIQKSDSLTTELEMTVERTLKFRSLITENRRLKSALQGKWNYIGTGQAMDEIRKLVATVAHSRSTVLISGESGTGKELIARAIHYQSPRQNGPFVKINCAALPEGLIESELFGHEKGAFTGAFKRKAGKFELAHGGTLLLDEIGEMPMAMQAKLLRVLQEREVSKVGGDEPVLVDVRVVATTNRNLEKDVHDGRFREDLFYRLNVFHVSLPPLRERKQDIPGLVDHFIHRFNEENGFSVDGMETSCLSALTAYDWPGNIRELENAVERAVVLTRSGKLRDDVFAPRSGTARTGGQVAGGAGFKAGMTVSQAEKELILMTLEHCGQNRTRAAQMLDISIRTLRNKLREYGQAVEGEGEEVDAA